MHLVFLRPQLEFKNPSDTPCDPVRKRNVLCRSQAMYVNCHKLSLEGAVPQKIFFLTEASSCLMVVKVVIIP